jgi:hypothetical protein
MLTLSLHMNDTVSTTFDRILATGFNPKSASFEERVVVLVVAAQGILDNGGFAYLLGKPFDPPANDEDFARAYAAIGAHDCAVAIAAAFARRTSGEACDWSDLDDVIVGRSKEVDALLARWIERNKELLP